MEKHETKTVFEGKEIRASWDSAQKAHVYAISDALDALTDGDGRKLWTRRKVRAKSAGTGLTGYTQARMAGIDGKMRRTDAATADQLSQILTDMNVTRADALTQWLASEDSGNANAAPRKRRRGGRSKSASSADAAQVTAAQNTVDTADTAASATTATPPATAADETAPRKRRRSRSKSAHKDASAVTAQADAPVAPAVATPVDPEPIAATADTPSEPAPRKRGRRGGRSKSAKKDAANASAQTVETISAAVEDIIEPSKASEKAKDKAAQRRSKTTQKAVTKAAAKAAVKAVVKVAEKVVEQVVERPQRRDDGEHIRMAIGHRESIAVLIDADNAQLSKLKATIDELSKFGRIVVKKAYGDWKNPCLKNWESVLTDLAVKPEQQFAYTKGKNATDIALVIDAMDLLATGRYDTFAIICSDSDYTPLVMRLRETGAYVFGVGADKTPSPFVNACDVFINTRIFIEEKPASVRPAALPAFATPLAGLDVYDVFRLMEAATELYQDVEGWTSISDAGSHIKRMYPGFRVKKYGYAKLADLVLAYPDRFVTKTYLHKGATILAYQVVE